MGPDCSTRLLSPGNRGPALAEAQGGRGAATLVDRGQDPPWAHTWLSTQPWAPPHAQARPLSRVPSALGLPACAGGPRPLLSHLLRSRLGRAHFASGARTCVRTNRVFRKLLVCCAWWGSEQ